MRRNLFNISLHSSVYLILCSGLLLSCGPKQEDTYTTEEFEVSGFHPLSNMEPSRKAGTSYPLKMDYTGAINGFILPSKSQNGGNAFEYRFQIKNKGNKSRRLKYKIYYQNESYKFPEISEDDSCTQNPLAQENFYGSWEEPGEGFRETAEIPADGKFHEVRGSLRIVGNPRNEKRYFSNDQNDRWKRNPRPGKYSFLLVVAEEEVVKSTIPSSLGDLSPSEDSSFIHPYFYFLNSCRQHEGLLTIKSADTLVVSASPPIKNGIYVDPQNFSPEEYSSYFTSFCGNDQQFQNDAAFKQFVHYIDSSATFRNIPVLADLTSGFSLRDYNWYRAFTASEEMLGVIPTTIPCPCTEAISDSSRQSITLINRASEWGNFRKQNVGLITRHGFTYGTYTVKVKMPELLNAEGIWNGLTNAIWLITQAQQAWNDRRACDKRGYILDYYDDGSKKRGTYSSYSEIDFEILKTVSYCPEYTYPPFSPHPVSRESNPYFWDLPYPGGDEKRDEIMVCCTNWDMACPQPWNYNVGCQDLKFGQQLFQAHRWDHWYKALSIKTPASDNELFEGSYFYFQIVWKPDEIIWKIGPEKDRLRVVAYMNSSVTSIPNNQMLLIISQEYHPSEWWPGSPFLQSYLPFPSRDLQGEVFEISIE